MKKDLKVQSNRDQKEQQKTEKAQPKTYQFGAVKKISLSSIEVYGTLCTSVSSDKEINSLELIA